MSYTLNYDYIVGELCLSNFEPGHENCNGYCVFKKNIEHHNGNEEDHSQPESIRAHQVYLTYLIPQSSELEAPVLQKDRFSIFIPQDFNGPYLFLATPPPRV